MFYFKEKTESIRFIIQGYLWCAVFKIRMEEKINTIGRFIISPLIANNIIIFLVIAYILISSKNKPGILENGTFRS